MTNSVLQEVDFQIELVFRRRVAPLVINNICQQIERRLQRRIEHRCRAVLWHVQDLTIDQFAGRFVLTPAPNRDSNST